MNKKRLTKSQMRIRRHARVRSHISGSAQRPRFCVFRSLRSLSLQLIDDQNGVTLVSVNSKKDIPKKADVGDRKGKVAESYLLGMALAEKAKEKKISTVVFDRAGYKYHGRVRAAAEGARDTGLVF